MLAPGGARRPTRMIFVLLGSSAADRSDRLLSRPPALQRQRTARPRRHRGPFHLLAEQSSDMVTRIGLDNRLLYVSPSCARITGWSAEELLGTSALAGHSCRRHGTGRAGHRRPEERRGRGGTVRLSPASPRQGRDLGRGCADVTLASDGGAIDGVVAVVRDMTAQRIFGTSSPRSQRPTASPALPTAAPSTSASPTNGRAPDGRHAALAAADRCRSFQEVQRPLRTSGGRCLPRALGRILSAQARRAPPISPRAMAARNSPSCCRTPARTAVPKSARVAKRCKTSPCCTRKIPHSAGHRRGLGGAAALPSQATTDSSTLGRRRRPRPLRGQGRRPRPAGMSGQVIPWPAKSA